MSVVMGEPKRLGLVLFRFIPEAHFLPPASAGFLLSLDCRYVRPGRMLPRAAFCLPAGDFSPALYGGAFL